MDTPRLARRSFVLGAGGALVAKMLWPTEVRAHTAAMPPFSFLVVSDTHLGYRDQPTAARQWEQTVTQLNAATGDFVLHLGDVVDGGREAQYAVYRDIRRGLRKAIHEIPGNHDPRDLFERHIRTPIDTSFDHQGVRFVLFNNSRRDSHLGFISPEQIAWLDNQFAEAVRHDLFVVLCCHVPVHTNRSPDRGWYVHPAEGQDALYRLIDRHRQRVLAMLHGHFHNGVRGWNDHGPLQEVAFPSTLYNQDRALAARNAPGFYLAELRPGFVRVSIDRAGMTLHYKPLAAAQTTDRVCPLPQLARDSSTTGNDRSL